VRLKGASASVVLSTTTTTKLNLFNYQNARRTRALYSSNKTTKVESEIPPLTKQTNQRKKNNKLYTWIIKRVWDVCIRHLSTTTIHITVVMGEPWYTWLKSLKQRKIKTLLICEMKTTSRLVQHRQKYKMRIVGWILNYLPSKLKNICIFETITQKH